MAEILKADQFYLRGRQSLIVDVRSPSEFKKGHIPGAINIPLFEDDERALIGTLYKQKGREKAIQTGLEVVGPKMAHYVEDLKAITSGPQVYVYCWRGGMRSESMAWLFETSGYSVGLLEGGYKAWRHYIREQIGKPRKYIVLGGLTGSGKTRWLKQLEEKGEQVIDLEWLARHKGSVFGAIGMDQQPSNEQFENDLFEAINRQDVNKIIWIEDESRQIGKIFLPDTFYEIKTASPVAMIEVPDDMRIRFLLEDYTDAGAAKLLDPVQRLAKRLGGDRTREIREAIETGRLEAAARLLLQYYDSMYKHGLNSRNAGMVQRINLMNVKEEEFADRLIAVKNMIYR